MHILPVYDQLPTLTDRGRRPMKSQISPNLVSVPNKGKSQCQIPKLSFDWSFTNRSFGESGTILRTGVILFGLGIPTREYSGQVWLDRFDHESGIRRNLTRFFISRELDQNLILTHIKSPTFQKSVSLIGSRVANPLVETT